MSAVGEDLAAGSFKAFKQCLAVSEKHIARQIWAAGAAGSKVKSEVVAVANIDKIVRATLKLSNKKGFAATSLRDLSTETGLSMGGLYAYISGKDELAALIQHHGRALVTDVLAQHMNIENAAAAKLRAGIRAHLFLSEVLQPWFFFGFMEARHLAKPQKAAAIESEQETETLFRDLIQAGIDAEEFSPTDAGLTAAMLKALLQDWYLKRGKYRRRNIDVERYADQVVALLLNHLAVRKD